MKWADVWAMILEWLDSKKADNGGSNVPDEDGPPDTAEGGSGDVSSEEAEHREIPKADVRELEIPRRRFRFTVDATVGDTHGSWRLFQDADHEFAFEVFSHDGGRLCVRLRNRVVYFFNPTVGTTKPIQPQDHYAKTKEPVRLRGRHTTALTVNEDTTMSLDVDGHCVIRCQYGDSKKGRVTMPEVKRVKFGGGSEGKWAEVTVHSVKVEKL